MGKSKLIYFSEDNANFLNSLDNQSQLINSLVSDYIKKTASPEERIDIAKATIEEAKNELNKAHIDRKQRIEREEELIKAIEPTVEEMRQIRRTNQKIVFDKYMVPEEQKTQLFEDYLQELENKSIHNIIEFMAIRGFIRKDEAKAI